MKVSGSSAPPRPLGQVVFSQRHLRPGGAAPHRGLPRSHRHLRPHQHRRLPRDDTADNRFTLFTNYKFKGNLAGWIVGLGADWVAQRAYFSGITRGSGQLQTDTEGDLIVLFMPDQLKLNGFVRRAWTKGGYNQFLQLNVDNLLKDTKLYGLIYNPPISAKITYEIAF